MIDDKTRLNMKKESRTQALRIVPLRYRSVTPQLPKTASSVSHERAPGAPFSSELPN
jgi:hypothetical protein